MRAHMQFYSVYIYIYIYIYIHNAWRSITLHARPLMILQLDRGHVSRGGRANLCDRMLSFCLCMKTHTFARAVTQIHGAVVPICAAARKRLHRFALLPEGGRADPRGGCADLRGSSGAVAQICATARGWSRRFARPLPRRSRRFARPIGGGRANLRDRMLSLLVYKNTHFPAGGHADPRGACADLRASSGAVAQICATAPEAVAQICVTAPDRAAVRHVPGSRTERPCMQSRFDRPPRIYFYIYTQ